jgi:cell division initiation protein
MDISPKTLREVEFREKFRGYHPEDVDTFLERVAVGIEALQVQLRQATERAAHAEQLAAETGTTDEALSRTLLLAQRTADTAVEEAREQAARIVATAESQARIILEEASQRAQRVAEEAQAALRADLAELESAREQLRSDVGLLDEWVEEHRTSLSATLTGLLRQLEKGVRLKSPTPAVADVEIPPDPVVETPEAPTAEALQQQQQGGAGGAVEGGEESAPGGASGDAADDAPARAEVVAAAEDEPVEQVAMTDVGEPDADEMSGRGDGGGSAAGADDDATSQAGDEDDPFMAELRRAVTDTEPLGPRDEAEDPEGDVQRAEAASSALQDELEASRRFGSRLRKRR